jgi:hypothetical protein
MTLEFIYPILRELMVDLVILQFGRTYERACVELTLVPPRVEPQDTNTVIPNTTLKATIDTWCARTGRDLPTRPSSKAVWEAMMSAMQLADGTVKSVRTNRRPAVVTMATSGGYYGEDERDGARIDQRGAALGTGGDVAVDHERETAVNARAVRLATVNTGDSTNYHGKTKLMANKRMVRVTVAREREPIR